MQVGILRALLEREIHPDFIVGVSAGAWNSVWLASRPQAASMVELERAWLRVGRLGRTIRWWSFARNLFRRRLCRSDGWGLASLAGHHLRQLGVRHFADLEVPLYIVALDLTAGRKAIFSTGPLAPAVLASSAVPGTFAPVVIDGHAHVDGGLVDPTGLDTALQLGASRVYVIDVGYVGALSAPLRSAEQIVEHSLELAGQLQTDRRIQQAGGSAEIIHLQPRADRARASMDFRGVRDYLAIGRQYAMEAIVVRRPRRVGGERPKAASSPAPHPSIVWPLI
jgi:NTE family protein